MIKKKRRTLVGVGKEMKIKTKEKTDVLTKKNVSVILNVNYSNNSREGLRKEVDQQVCSPNIAREFSNCRINEKLLICIDKEKKLCWK